MSTSKCTATFVETMTWMADIGRKKMCTTSFAWNIFFFVFFFFFCTRKYWEESFYAKKISKRKKIFVLFLVVMKFILDEIGFSLGFFFTCHSNLWFCGLLFFFFFCSSYLLIWNVVFLMQSNYIELHISNVCAIEHSIDVDSWNVISIWYMKCEFPFKIEFVIAS